jgi:cytidine deaminase
MSDRSPTAAQLALYERACELRERAYVPYSHFPVGAVLVAEDGRTFEGVNVENGSYGLTICAERTACVRAVSEGARRFTAIGVSTHDSASTGSPCGACRQFLSEFGLDLVVVYRREGEVVAEPLSALLPAAFELRE